MQSLQTGKPITLMSANGTMNRWEHEKQAPKSDGHRGSFPEERNHELNLKK